MSEFNLDQAPPTEMAIKLIGAGALLSIPFLLLYGWLWWSALGMSHRLDPALDLYASLWSLAAIGLAGFHGWLAFRRTRQPHIRVLVLMLAISVLIVATCPEFFY